jgi:hypothetical protein
LEVSEDNFTDVYACTCISFTRRTRSLVTLFVCTENALACLHP